MASEAKNGSLQDGRVRIASPCRSDRGIGPPDGTRSSRQLNGRASAGNEAQCRASDAMDIARKYQQSPADPAAVRRPRQCLAGDEGMPHPRGSRALERFTVLDLTQV